MSAPLARAPRASRFASIKVAFAKEARDLARAHRRDAATQPPELHRDAPAGALRAGIEPLRLLQAVLDHADVIALDKPERGRSRHVYMLLTIPTWLLDRATVIASYDADDEDTDGGDDQQDLEADADNEFSLGFPDAIVDQSRKFPRSILVGGTWQNASDDLELDPAEREPSLGSLGGGDPDFDQEHWADGDRLDRERGPGDGDCDDDEPDHDREWESPEPSASPIAYQPDLTARIEQLARLTLDGEPPQVWLPTGNRPGGGLEMRNQTTGQVVVGHLLTRDGERR